MRAIYFHDRNAEGHADVREEGSDFKEFFWGVWEKRGLREDQIAAKWTEYRNEQTKAKPR